MIKLKDLLTEDYKKSEWEVYVADDPYGKNQKVVKRAKSKRAAVILYNKLIKTDKYAEVGMRVVKEGKLSEASSKVKNQIKKIMKYDHIDDLADYIEQFDIDKKHWRVISHYFNNIRDEDMGFKPSGYADKSRKELQKILFKVIKEGKLSEAIGKGMFWKDLKSGTSIEFTGGTTYVVTKIDKNKLQMSLKRRGKTGGGLFAPKAKLDKSQFESQVKVGLIKYLTNTNPRIKEGKLKEEIEPKGGMAKIAAIVKNKQHGKVGGKTVDMQSANLLMKLYNAVKDKDKEKMNKMNEKKLVMVLHKLWTRVNLKLPV